MYKTFTLPLKSAFFALAALFILTACGGFTIDLNSFEQDSECSANPFLTECDSQRNISAIRTLIIEDCASNPEKSNTRLCLAAEDAINPPSDEDGAEGGVAEVFDNTPKDIEIKSEFDKDSLTKTDKEKGETTTLEIVDLCSDPANAGNERCTPAVINCITNPFSGDCEGDNVLGNFVRGAVTVSKTVVLQDKRAEDCRTGRIDRALCQNLSVQKQRCAGAAFSTDAICSAVAYSVCKADAFDPLCGEKEDFQGVYFNERSNVCFADPNNPHCKGASGHVAVVCSEYPFDRLCTGNTDYDDARASACETDPTVSASCPVAPAVPVADVCLDNPFGPTCADSDYNNARKELVKTCAIQAVTGAVTSACDTIIAEALPCVINPFDTVCDSNPAVKTYIAQLRSTRVAFCNSNLRIASLCTGAPVAKSVCRIDPFDTVCLGDNDYAGDRLSACRDGSATTGQCSNIIAGVCGDNPFDALCGNGYTGERETACRNGSTNTQCGNIVAGVCSGNPFDAVCGSNYDGNRERACASNPNSSRCRDTLTRVCGGNPFSRLCRNTQSYLNARVNICRGNPLDGRCGGTISGICNDDPFDTVCPESGWNNARETACRNGSTNTQCGGIIAGVCSGNPFDPLCGSGYTQNRRNACSGDPFAPRCADAGYNDLRVSFCEGRVGTHSSCPAPEPTEVTAEVWADSFDTPLSHAASRDDTESKFLIGRETDLDTGGARLYSSILSPNRLGALTLADATFNGVALGGDRADGVAFFAAANNGRSYAYAGILEGTNLGAPLTDTIGTAKWIGSFQVKNLSATDFVLNVSFGTGEGVGEIEAVVRQYHYAFYMEGEFDDAGVITGTARSHIIRTIDPDNSDIGNRVIGGYPGKLTGLIGEEGAVGAFLIGSSFGGFVARPSSAEELRTVEQICADDPFNRICNIGYDSERDAVIRHCIIGDNANDENCDSANDWDYCIKHPFISGCFSRFQQYYQQARANRVAFCRTVGNGDNDLCTDEKVFAYICTKYPFDAQCLGDSDYDNTREYACYKAGAGSTECELFAGLTCGSNPFSSYCDSGYNDARETACRAGSTNTQCGGIISGICGGNPFDTLCGSGYTQNRRNACTDNPFAPRCAGNVYNDLRVSFCEDNVGTHSSCPAPTPTEVTAEVWVDSFDEDLAHGVNAADKRTQFLIGKATDLDDGGVTPYTTLDYDYSSNLNLADATFNGTALGGDRADGVAFFAAKKNKWNYYGYAGILSGTNLGAPLTDTEGSAKWIGTFRIGGGSSPLDFVLNVSFGTGSGAGEIEALIQKYNYWYDYHIEGEFDDSGVITGNIRHGIFETNDPNNRGSSYGSNKLTGIIGEEGAIGAFFIRNTFGGFVARPSSAEELQSLAQTCADDPFHEHCNIGYESERSALVERCDLNPFISNCGWRYNDAREYACITNRSDTRCPDVIKRVCNENLFSELCNDNQVYFDERVTYCRSVLWDEPYCEEFKRTTCVLDPFDTLCDSGYTQNRRNACSGDPFAPRCAGNVYNDLRVTFCENNAGNPACPQPVVPTATSDRVTTADWVASFDGELPSSPTDTRHGFLEATADALNSGTLGSSPYYRHTRHGVKMFNLNFDTGSYDGKYLNGDVEDGVAFFEGVPYQGSGRYRYAGILSGTDLGAPINRIGTATWHGSINETSWYFKNTDFSLDIVFNGATGGTIKGFSQSSNTYKREIHFLLLTGRFDANGVITGTSNKGFFTDGNPDLPIPGGSVGRRVFGTLTGLIGEEGAVGAFSAPNGGTYIGYAGGFVVRPSAAFDSPEALVNNARVTTADWLESFDEDLTVRRQVPAGSIGSYKPAKNHFVKASKTGLALQNYSRAWYEVRTFANITFDGKAVGGDVADGFALSNNPHHYATHHAGILSGTDLGAPLTQRQGSASWEGRMIVLASFSRSAVSTDFVLHINFGAGSQVGTVTGQVRTSGPGDADYKYRVDGDFDEAGVIKGVSQYGNFNYESSAIPRYWRSSGTLTGLIGEEGAIGVFISDEIGYAGYVGGFIAAPSLQNYVTSGDLADHHGLAWPTDPLFRTEVSSFLAASSTGEMNTGTLLTRDGSTPIVETLTLANATYQGRGLGGDATDGVAFFKGWKGPTDTLRSSKIHYRVYSGIFDDINLGAPVTQTSGKAYWKGQFKSVHFDRVVSKDFTLEVSFYEGLGLHRAGRVEALVHDTGLKHFKVYGTFNNRGVIDGSITFGDYEYNIRTEPYLSYKRADLLGLIGQEGALAIFKSNTPYINGDTIRKPTTDFAGGFAVVPDLPDLPTPAPDTTPNRVTAEDWVASFETAPALVNNPNNHHFMQFPRRRVGGIEGIVLFANILGFERLNQTILTLDDNIFQDGGGDATDGVFFVRADKNTDSDDADSYFYAGIIPETDLGAPLTQTTGTATWSGRFKAAMSGGILRYFSRDFTLDITFNATGGEISAIVAGRTVDYFEVDGTFNNRGVISGTASHVYYENGRIGNVTGDIVNSGPLRGLIGEEGAVGAFISNRQTGSTSGFAGGFVARPPSE